MSDVSDGSGSMPRRTPRVSDGGAPVSGALAMLLAALAVVAGFFILRSISGNGDETADFPDTGTGVATGGDESNDGDPSATSAPVATLATTTTLPLIVTDGIVLVANANGMGGSASDMTRALEVGAGFKMASPVDASAASGDIETSVIYYDASVPSAKLVADSLSLVLGGVASVAPVPETPPTSDGTMGDAVVLLMLGKDKAFKSLEELAPGVLASATSPQITSPPVAGATPTTTNTTTTTQPG